MGGNYSRLTTRTNGNTIDGPTDDAEFDNIIDNSTPAGLDDASANVAAMRATTDPYPAAVESLATSTEGEFERLRFILKQLSGEAQWYIDPDASVAELFAGFGAITGITAATFTPDETNYILSCNTTSNNITVNLPDIDGTTIKNGKAYLIKKSDASANTVTIDADSTDTIDGALTLVLTKQYDFVILVALGGNAWQVFATNVYNSATLARISDYTNSTHDHSDNSNGGTISLAVNNMPDGTVVQAVHTEDNAVATGTTVMPIDDTIPQNTEGDEYMTLAITPNATTNRLVIEAQGYFNHTNTSNALAIALFQDATADALSASAFVYRSSAASTGVILNIKFEMPAGTTSSTTFKMRVGNSAAGTTTFNGLTGSRLFGGVANSFMRITEVKAS